MQQPLTPNVHIDASIFASATKLVHQLTVEPNEQLQVLLGEFDHDTLLRGYSIELSPDPSPRNSIVTHIHRAEEATQYKLYLYIANKGRKTISAAVSQL